MVVNEPCMWDNLPLFFFCLRVGKVYESLKKKVLSIQKTNSIDSFIKYCKAFYENTNPTKTSYGSGLE